MPPLTLAQFVPMLARFPHDEFLDPIDSLRLSLLMVELLVDRTVDYPLLKYLSRFLSPKLYDDVIEERNIEHTCGYIICSNLPKARRSLVDARIAHLLSPPNGFQIYARKPLMILPNTHLLQYCCKEHYQALTFYRNQLLEEAVFGRANIMVAPPFPADYPSYWYENGITCLEEVLEQHRQDTNKLLSEIIAQLAGLRVDDANPQSQSSQQPDPTNKLIELINNFEIVEHEDPKPDLGNKDEEDDEDVATNPDGYRTSARAWGGYVV